MFIAYRTRFISLGNFYWGESTLITKRYETDKKK